MVWYFPLSPHLCTPYIKQAIETKTKRTTSKISKILIIIASLMNRPQRFRARGLYMTSSRTPRKTYAPVYSVNSINVPNRSHAVERGQKPTIARYIAKQNITVPAQPDRVASPGDLWDYKGKVACHVTCGVFSFFSSLYCCISLYCILATAIYTIPPRAVFLIVHGPFIFFFIVSLFFFNIYQHTTACAWFVTTGGG